MPEEGRDPLESKLFVPVERRFAAGLAVISFTLTFLISLFMVEDLLTIALRAGVAFLTFAALGYLSGLLVMYSSDPRVLAERLFLSQLEESIAQRKAVEEQHREVAEDQQLTFIGGMMPGSQPVEE